MVNRACARSGRVSLGCLGTIAVLAVVAYLGVQLGPPWLHYQQFRDEMISDARYGVSLPDSVIRARLVARADSLRLPAAAKHISIIRRRGTSPTITISTHYDEPVQLIFLGTKFLRFKPSAEAPL